MPKKPAPPSDPPAKPRRGRPPKPGGRTPQVEVQRAYRARLVAAGKVVRIIDANAVPIPGFDPAKDGSFERQMVESARDQLRNALSEGDYLKEEVARLRERNTWLEAELKREERNLTNAQRDNVMLKQQLAQKPGKRRLANQN